MISLIKVFSRKQAQNAFEAYIFRLCLEWQVKSILSQYKACGKSLEPRHEKTCHRGPDLVRLNLGCAATEDGFSLNFLAHLSQRLMSYSIPMLRRPALLSLSSSILKHLPLRTRLANQSQTSCGTSLGRGNESLYKWSRWPPRSYIFKTFKIFFSRIRSPMILKLCM